jgi:hypothetical protein
MLTLTLTIIYAQINRCCDFYTYLKELRLFGFLFSLNILTELTWQG